MATIGIDLGTTNSLAVTYREGEVELIPNSFGDYLTPSVVHVSDDVLTVGKIAKERLVTDPDNTAQLFKRSMGTNEMFYLDGEAFSATDLSTLVVKQLVADAESYLGEKVDEVLISVPAYFNEKQRSATKAIGQRLGIKVERLINEPSAAAIACHKIGKDESFIVFDFGGGTLDVSVVDCFDNVISIVSIAGDNFLGGSDFDKAIAEDFCQSQGIDLEKLDTKQKSSLLLSAERCKLKLQKEKLAAVSLTYDDQYYMKQYTQAELKSIIQPVLDRVKKVIGRAVSDSGYRAHELDAFILVGGSSMMPLVQSYIMNLLNLPIKRLKDMDELVARGLGTYLAVKERQEKVKDLVITDICPFSLGISAYDSDFDKNIFSKVINKLSVLPTSASKYYYASRGQKQCRFMIYQGESLDPEANLFLDEFIIDVPGTATKTEFFETTFTYDINSMLYIEVKLGSTGETKTYRIGSQSKIEEVDKSEHLENIKLVSDQLSFEADFKTQTERAYRLIMEMPYKMQLHFLWQMEDFEKGYQLVINNIKKRKEIVKRYQAYLDSIENIMSLDDLDIFRQEEADHEETGEPFDRSDDPNFWR